MFRNATNSNRTRGRFISLASKKRGTQQQQHQPVQSSQPLPPSKAAIGTSAIHGFSAIEMRDLQKSFATFDTEGTGTIRVGDFRNVLLSLQQQEEDEENDIPRFPHVPALLAQLDEAVPDDDQELDFDDYLQLMTATSISSKLQQEENGTNFAHIFELFDADGKGYITVQDLERVAIQLGELDMTHAELEEMIQRANAKEAGKVRLDEFSRIMTLNLFHRREEASAPATNDNS